MVAAAQESARHHTSYKFRDITINNVPQRLAVTCHKTNFFTEWRPLIHATTVQTAHSEMNMNKIDDNVPLLRIWRKQCSKCKTLHCQQHGNLILITVHTQTSSSQLFTVFTIVSLLLKDHRQRIPKKIVIRRYLERSIQKKFFSNLHSLQIKTIFQEKSSFAKTYCRGICDLYLWSWRHSLVPIQASGANCECC